MKDDGRYGVKEEQAEIFGAERVENGLRIAIFGDIVFECHKCGGKWRRELIYK